MSSGPPRNRRGDRRERARPPEGRPASQRRRPPERRTTTSRGQRAAGAEQRPRRRSDLLARILVAVPAAVVAIVFVDLGGTPWAGLMLAISWLCMYELYRLLGRWRPAMVVGFAAAAGLVIAARLGSERTVLEVAVAALPVAFAVVASRGGSGVGSVSVAGTLLGVWWLGVPFAFAVLLMRLHHGTGVMIDVMVGTFLGDTGAYIGGRLFGRRPLAPSISPHKTLEGLLFGMLFAVMSVYAVGLNQPWLTHGDALLLGIAIAVLGPVGDLFESMVKRDAGAKDAGGVLGAHGGALDRLDAIIFTVVAGYFIWSTVGH